MKAAREIHVRPDACDEAALLIRALELAQELEKVLDQVRVSPILGMQERHVLDSLAGRARALAVCDAPETTLVYAFSLPGLAERAASHGKESGTL